MYLLLDNRLFYRLAVITQRLVLASSAVQLLVSGYQYYLIRRSPEVAVPEWAVVLLDQWQPVLGYTRIGLVLLAFLAFVAWFYRGYENLHRLRETPRPTYSVGWAVGGWLVPFLNLWYPYSIMKELWLLTQRYAFDAEVSPDHGLVKGWWMLRIVAWLVSRGAQTGSQSTITTLAQLQEATVLSIISVGFDVGYALVTLALLKQQAHHEALLATRFSNGSNTPILAYTTP